MKVGIIGAGGCGKTTLFNALTGQTAQTGGGAKKTHVGVVKVPDKRLVTLQKMTGRKNRTPAEIAFSDVAGEFTKPSRDKGLSPELANMMKPLDAFAIIIGEFPEFVETKSGKTSALAEASEIESDLILSDLVVVENRIERMKKEPASEIEKKAIEKCKAALEEEKPLRAVEFNSTELGAISSYAFLTRKPTLFIRNVGEDSIGAEPPADLVKYANDHDVKLLTVCAKIEMEISQMAEGEREEFLKAMGLDEPAIDRFVRASYEACSLICFFTTGAGGVDESRAWTIHKGWTAAEAGGKIHSDIQRGFIRAEVIGYDDFIEFGGFEGAKTKGKLRLEGKEYIVRDGDIMNFRFNV